MQASRLSSALPAPMARRRNLILASALSSMLLIPGGILVNYYFFEVARDDVLSVVAMFLSCLAPLLGLSALLVANQDLERIRKGIVPSSVRVATTWGRKLGMVGLSANIILLVVFIAQAFSFGKVASARELMVQDVRNLFLDAYRKRIHPVSKDSGGTYTGYVVPRVLAQSEIGFYTATALHPDTLLFTSRWREDSTATIRVRIGPDGKLVEPWIFSGKFER